jgi:hypothetical protein
MRAAVERAVDYALAVHDRHLQVFQLSSVSVGLTQDAVTL